MIACVDCGRSLGSDGRKRFCPACLRLHRSHYRLSHLEASKRWRDENRDYIRDFNRVYGRKWRARMRVLRVRLLRDVQDNPRKYLDRVEDFSHVPLRVLRENRNI